MGEVLMNAKHVGFFSHWARLRPFPQRGLYFGAQFQLSPQRKIGRLRVYFATNPTGVMVFPVPEELTLK